MHLHTAGSSGLRSNHCVPSRVSMGSQRFRWSDYSYLELAVTYLHLRPHRSQPLRDVRPIPPNRRYHRFGFARSNRSHLGLLRLVVSLVDVIRWKKAVLSRLWSRTSEKLKKKKRFSILYYLSIQVSLPVMAWKVGTKLGRFLFVWCCFSCIYWVRLDGLKFWDNRAVKAEMNKRTKSNLVLLSYCILKLTLTIK